MAKIAGVIILFNPGQEVAKNILSYSGHISKLFIVDNSQTSHSMQLKQSLNGVEFEIIHDSQNRGIAFRLNQVAKMAINSGYEFLLTMDQDSYFEDPDIAVYLNCIDAINWGKIAMTGIAFDAAQKNIPNCNFTIVTDVITSGSVLNLRLFNIIGGFDENLFIDEVDHDYCYTAAEKGFSIGMFDHINLIHNLGEQSIRRSYKSFQKSPRALHSPIRLYYMTRNFLYVQRKHKGLAKLAMKNKRRSLLIRIKNNLLYGQDRLAVLKYILKGVIDFNYNRMGPLTK